MRDLLVICPTLWRRANAERLLDSWASAPRATDSDLLLVADEGDDSYDGLTLPAGASIDYWEPGAWVVEKTNMAARRYLDGYQAFMSTGDDVTFDTPGWDALMVEPMSDGLRVTYPGSIRTWPETFCLPRQVISGLGWMMLPDLRHYFADRVWAELGGTAGVLVEVPRVSIREHHYLTTPGVVRDATYQRAEGQARRDEIAFHHWLSEGGFAADLARLQQLANPQPVLES